MTHCVNHCWQNRGYAQVAVHCTAERDQSLLGVRDALCEN